MIRKLKSGEYRLYSKKTDPRPASARTLGHFRIAQGRKSTSARCRISSGTSRPPVAAVSSCFVLIRVLALKTR